MGRPGAYLPNPVRADVQPAGEEGFQPVRIDGGEELRAWECVQVDGEALFCHQPGTF